MTLRVERRVIGDTRWRGYMRHGVCGTCALPERIPTISRSGQISQFRICSDPVRLFWYQDFISNYVRSDRKFKKNRKFKIPVSNKRCTGQNISNYLVFFWTRYDFWSVWSRFSDFGSFSKTGAKPRVVKNREHPTKLVREAWAWFETTICFMWVLIVVNLDGFHGARYHQITTRSSEMH
jgi:hypothetical protein